MLIVSQNKDTVVNLGMIESVFAGDDNTIRAFAYLDADGNDRHYPIGEYENKSKAKSVLMQMWSAYNNGEKVFIMP